MTVDYNNEEFYKQDFTAERLLLLNIRNNLTSHESQVNIPEGLKFVYDPEISQVYITLFQGDKKRLRWGSKKSDLKATVERILFKLKNHKLFSEYAVGDPLTCRILFEIVTDEYPCNPRETTIYHLHENRLEPGIHGLKFKYNDQPYYYMPTEAVTQSLMTMKQVYNYLAKRTGIAKQTNRISERASIMRSLPIEFKIIKSFAFISYNDDVLPLYRGYPVPVQFSKQIALDSLKNSSDWMLNQMKPNGQFLYFYDGVKDSEVDFQHPRMLDPTYYNILRHSGGSVTLLRAYEITGASKYLDAAKDSFDFFVTVLREHSYQGKYACYPFFNKKSKLGGAGIGLVALIQYYRLSGDSRYRKYIDGLVNHILSRVSDTGEMIGYFIHPNFFNGGEIIDPDDDVKKELFSFYYPGEALLGLALYLNHIPGIDEKTSSLVKEKSKLALDFLIHERPKKYDYMFASLPSDAWLMQAIEEWVKIDGFDDQAYIDFVFNDAQAMIDHMYQEANAPFFDYVGAFYYQYGEHAYPDGSRCEGLIAAYYLALHLGDNERANSLMKYLLKSAKGLMYTYNTPESCYGHKNPQKSMYSFRFKLTRQWMRVDSVQHTACFFARLYPVLESNG